MRVVRRLWDSIWSAGAAGMLQLLIVGAGNLHGAGIPYFTDFENGLGPEWSVRTVNEGEPWRFSRFYGRLDGPQSLTLTGLTPGVSYTVGFDLYIIDSWDGGNTSSGDIFQVAADGTNIFRESFGNYNTQTYSRNPDEGREQIGFNTYLDAIYRNVEATFTATGAVATITFSGVNLQAISDESWGIDNVGVRPTAELTNTVLRASSLPAHNTTNAAPVSAFVVSASAPLSPTAATNSVNWSLKEAGANGVLGDGDDTSASIAASLPGTFFTGRSVWFAIANGPLQPGRYRFQSAAALVDTNGLVVPVYTRDFVISHPVLGQIENTANDSLIGATPLTLAESPAGSGFLTALGIGVLPATSDVDYWRFDVEAGDRLSARLEAAGENSNPRLYLQNVSGGNIVTVNGNAAGLASFQGYTFSSPGTFYLRIWSDSRAVPYRLRLDLGRSSQLEAEPNDSVAAANTLTLNAAPGLAQARVAGALPSDDPSGDYFGLGTLNAGNALSVTVRFPDGSTLNAGNALLQVFRSGDTNVLATNSGASLNFTVTTDGSYFVRSAGTERDIRSQYVLDFAISDGVAPSIASTSLPAEAGGTGEVIDRFTLNFSEQLLPAPVSAGANYELRGAGNDGLLGTSDDTFYQVVPDVYSGGLANGYTIPDGPLQPGPIRLTVFTNLVDRVGNPMAAAFVRTFAVTNEPGFVMEGRNNNQYGLASYFTTTPGLAGDGTVGFAGSLGTGSGPYFAAAGQLGGDTNLDVAVPNYYANNVSVLTNDGRGNFALMTNVPTGSNPDGVVVARFDGDANEDIAVANWSSGTISILLATSGGFVVHTNISGFNTPYHPTAADLNNDGRMDLVVPNYNGHFIRVLLGNGDGTFQAGTNYSTPNNPRLAAIADLNNDTIPDLAVANDSGTVSLFRGNGDGTFQAPQNLASGGNTRSAAAADVTGDGVVDVISISAFENTLSVFRGNGNGTFQPRVDYANGTTDAYEVKLTDLNGDGRLDAVVPGYGNNTFALMLNNGSGAFTNLISYELPGNPISAVTGDFNRDGRNDVLFTRWNGAGVYWYYGNAAAPQVEDPPGSGTRSGFVRGKITDTSDTDYYRFTGTAGDLAIVAIETVGAPGSSSLRIDLLKADGNGLTGYYSAGNGWGQSAAVTLPYTGTYLVWIRRNNDFFGEYRLRITTVKPPLLAESEDNNSIANANRPALVLTNGHLRGTVAGYLSRGDAAGDFFNLGLLPGGATINLGVVQPASSGFASILTVFNAAGQVVTNSASGATNLAFTVPAGSNTYYYARLTADPLPPALTIGGQPGAALLFNGSGDHVRMPDSPSLRPVNLTLEGWVNFSTISGTHVFFSKALGSADDDSYVVWYDSGTLRGYCSGGPNLVYPWSPELGRWYHVAYVFDDAANTHQLYLDGQSVTSAVNNATISFDSRPFQIGADTASGSPSYFFPGKIDEVRLWNVVRASNEIASARSQRLAGNEPGLAGYWRLDEGTGPSTADATANGNSGSLIGPPVWTASTLSPSRPMALAAQYLLTLDIADAAPMEVTGNTLPDNGSTVSNILQSFTLSFNKELDSRINLMNRVIYRSGGSVYLLTDSAGTWDDAEAFAVSVGGHLATINDADENVFLRQTFSPSGDVWIGLNDRAVEGAFQWISGQPVAYTNWLSSQPDNVNGSDGVYLDDATGQWVDDVGARRGIVEIPSTPDTDGDGLPDSLDPFATDLRNGIELRNAGVDGIFDTSDDSVYDLDTTGYSTGTNLPLNVVDGPLQVGLYRLTVSTALRDRFGNGLPTAYTRTFTVAPVPGFVLENRGNDGTSIATSLSGTPSDAMSGGFALGTNFATMANPHYVIATNLNGDTNLDLLVANYGADTLGVWFGQADGSMVLQTNLAAGDGPIGLALGDFNGDSQLDVAVALYQANRLSIMLGDGAGLFTALTNYPTPTQPYFLVVADFNKDSELDVITANLNGDSLSVFLGNGDGTFQPRVDIPVGDGTYSPAVADFNADSNVDIVVANRNAQTISLLLGNGDGTFQGATNFATSTTAGGLTAGDVNADGRADVIATSGQYLNIWFGNGDGTLAPRITIDIDSSDPYQVILQDIDGNGTPDIVVPSYGNNRVITVANFGDGTFGTRLIYGVSANPISVAAGDFNHDGRVDLVTTPYNGNRLQFLNGLGSQPLTVDGTTAFRMGAGRGALFSSSDNDYWSFSAAANERITLAVESVGGFASTGLRYIIYRPDGATQADFYPNANGLGEYSAILPASGTYTIRVLEWHAYRGEYRFRVTLAPPPLQFETEANDAIAQADPVTLTLTGGRQLASLFGYIGQGDTGDFFRLGNLSDGTAINLGVVRPGTSTMRPWLSLYNAAGVLVTNAVPGATNLTYTVRAGEGGAYYAEVQAANVARSAGISNALSFDGANDYVNTGNWSPGTRWSVHAWVMPMNYAAGRHTIAGGFGGCTDWGIVASDGRFGIGTRTPGGIPSCAQTFAVPELPELGRWYHVAGVNDGTNAYLYVNGVLRASGPVDLNYSAYGSGIWIAGESCCGNYFPGLIQNVAIWNRALSAAEVSGTVFTNLLGTESGLVGYWLLQDGTGTTAPDLSPSGRTGTLVNSPTWLPLAPPGVSQPGLFAEYRLEVRLTDTSPPLVIASTLPAEGTATSAIIDRFGLTFSEDMAPVAVTNVAGYELRHAGADGAFGTGDDQFYTVLNSPAYTGGTNASYLVPDGPLQPGLHRFTARTNITDTSGSPLASAFVRNFTVTNLPGFAFENRNNGALNATTSLSPARTNLPSGTLRTGATYPVQDQPEYLAAGLLNGDTHLDLVVANYNSDTLSVFTNDGSGGMVLRTNMPGSDGSLTPVLARFDNDAFLDLAVSDYQADTVTIYRGNGDATFARVTNYAVGDQPYGLVAADLNGDSRLDLATASYGADNLTVLLGNGDGTFQTTTNYACGDQPVHVAVGDVNGDTRMDLVVANFTTDNLSLFLGNGNGTFAPAIALAVNAGPRSVALVDLDTDGNLDIVSANNDVTVSLLYGNGDGTFLPRANLDGVYQNLYHVLPVDLNLDGRLDLAVSAFGNDRLLTFINRGGRQFEPANVYVTANGPIGLASGDFNQDGRPDIAVANYHADSFTVFFGGDTEPLSGDGLGGLISSGRGRGNLFDNGDVDFWSFQGNAGDRVQIAFQNVGAPAASGRCLIVYRPDGGQVGNFCTDYYGIGSGTITLPVSGTYNVRVAYNYTYAGEYLLRVSVIKPPVQIETEGNDGTSSADDLAFNTISGNRTARVFGSIDSGDPADFFRLGNLAAGTTVRLSFDRPTSSTLAGVLTLYKGSTAITNTTDGATNLVYFIPAGGEDVYYARITAVSNSAGLMAQYVLALDLSDTATPQVVSTTLPGEGSTTSGLIDRFAVSVNKDLDPRVSETGQNIRLRNGRAYFLSAASGSWLNTEAQALAFGGHLVSINDAAENEWISQNFGGTFWIGLTDEAAEGSFQWVSGEPFSYTNWNSGEPNNSGNEDYASMVPGGRWNDAGLGQSYPGLIEVAGADTDGDGIPDSADPYPADPLNLFDLRAAGTDGSFDTADDVVYRLVVGSYSSGLSVSLAITDGPLQPGAYRFRVTAELRDTFGNRALAPYDRFFTVDNIPLFTVENRSNDVASNATALVQTDNPTGLRTALARGKRFDSSDVDYWSFEASAGDVMMFGTEVPGNPGASQLRYRVYSPSGTQLLDFYPDYYGTGQAAPIVLTNTGTFTLLVSVNYDYRGEYRFRVTLATPTIQAEAEANDTIATANPLTLALSGNSRFASVAGTANAASDLDYFNLGTITNGSTVFLSVRLPVGSTYQPVVALYNAAGQYQGEVNSGNSGDSVAEVRILTTGAYHALVRGGTSASDLQAQYVLDIQAVPTGEVSFPNLVVSSVTLPVGTPLSGQQVTYRYTVANTGALATAVGNWLDRAAISTNTTLGDADDIALGFFPHFGVLAAGQGYAVTNTFPLPDGVSGDFYLIVQTDAGNAVNEFVFEADNTTVSAATFRVNRAPYPDLKIENLALSGPSGGTYTVNWTTGNRGDGAATTGFYERFLVRSLTSGLTLTNVESFTPGPLAVNGTLARNASITTTNPGSYQIEITTDSRNNLYEFDAVSHASAELNTATTNFVIAQFFNITVAANPTNAGTVTGGGSFMSGSSATVTATAITNTLPYYFVNWTENGVFQSALSNYTFTVTRSRPLVANFTLPAYTLTASNNPPSGGTVAGQGTYFHGSTNVLTAQPNPGWRFTNWTQNGSVFATTLAITNVSLSNRFAVANYAEANPFHIVRTATSPTNLAVVAGAGTYTNGQSGIITAPLSVTNPPNIYNFREFRLAGALVSTTPSFTKVFSTLDATNLEYIAFYDTVSILPLVTNVTPSIANPIPATTNFLLTLQFNRSMNTNSAPLVVLSNLATAAQITFAGGGRWSATAISNDTYLTPPATFGPGTDGNYSVFVSLAQDLNGGAMVRTNVASLVVDVTPPPLPTLTITSSNSSSVTVSWSGYSAPPDLSAFRAYLRTNNFNSVTGLPIIAGLSAATRSYTFGGLSLDRPYYLTIVPVDVAGNSIDAVSPIPVFLPSTVPPPVTVSVAAPSVDTAQVSWSGYNTANLFGFAGFWLYYETNNFTSVAGLTPRQTLSSGTRSAQATGLDRQRNYYFAVVGFNGTNGFNPSVTTAVWSDPYAGNITANLTIGGAGQTVEILQPITVLNNATLTVPAGTTLRFAPGAGITVQQGRITANGTALDPIVFTSISDTDGGAPLAGSWNGIALGSQAGASLLRHVFIKYGAGLTVDGSSPTVDAFTALYNRPSGLTLLNSASITTTDALLAFNGVGARQSGAAALTIRNSVIKNNGTNAQNSAAVSLIATQNWWGSAVSGDIDATLVGAVNRNNFLTGEPLLTPAIGTSNNVTQVGTSNVMLRLACRTADSMRVSEDSAFFAVFYEPFAPAKLLPLSEGGGAKTIYAQFRSLTGQTSAPVSVAITYITDGPRITAFSLAEGTVLTRPTNVTGSATAPLGMAAMELYVDGLGVATNAGGSFSQRFDMRTYTNGIHRVRLLARDNAGRFATLERNIAITPTPPPSPIIAYPNTSLLVTSNSVNVVGTAEPLVDVRLLRNGLLMGTTTASAAGAWSFSTVPLVEGDNVFVASAFDLLGSASSSERMVVLDSGPPTAPLLNPPIYRVGSGLEFAWQYALTGERPTRFRLFWHTAPFSSPAQATGQSPIISGPLTYLLAGLPAGNYYFGIVGYDDAGNASALSALTSYNYDPVPPSFSIAFDKTSPAGAGPLLVTVSSSEALAATPSVTLSYGSGPIAFTVSNSALNTWQGALNVGVFTPSGPVTFRTAGQDLAGNVFNGPPSGPAMAIDVAPPVGSITTVPLPPVQATNDTNVSVSLTLSEPAKVGSTPTLSFTPPGGAAVPIPLSGAGQNWVGILTLRPAMGSGFGQFTMSAIDALDNVGNGITNGASLEIYNTAKPSAPATPTGLRALSLAGGRVLLEWLPVGNAEIYRLYADPGSNGVPATVAADNIVPSFITNLPAADGAWRFAVSASRRDSESLKSTAITAFSDRTPPPAPTNVAVQLVAAGLRVSWQPGAGETASRFNVYRNGALIRTVTTATNIIDVPPRGLMSYVVGAADSLGNEALSLPATYELSIGAVVNLDVLYNLGQAPILTWQSGDPTTVGYNVYRNGVKQNDTLLASPTFTDLLGVQPGTFVNYAIKAVNSTNAESAARAVDVLDTGLSLRANLNGVSENTPITTYFDAYQVTVSNRSSAASLPLSHVELRRTIAGQPVLTLSNEVHSLVASNANLTRAIIFPGSTNTTPQSILVRAVQETDDGGSQVIYQTLRDFVVVEEPGVTMEVSADQPPLSGGLATLNVRVFNRGYADLDLVVTRGGGLQPGDLSVSVRNTLGQEVSRADYMGAPPGTFFLPNGTGFIRIAPGADKSFTVGNILVPDALGTNATTFIASFSQIYNGYNSATQRVNAAISGSMVSSLSLTPYYGTLNTDRTGYANDDLVQMTGQAIDRTSGLPVPNAPLKLGFFTRGFKFYYNVTSDISGSFTYTYSPPPGVSGTFKLWAAHPDVFDVLNQREIKIYRAYLSPVAADIRMTKNDTLSFNLTLMNPGDEILTGFTLQTDVFRMLGTNMVPITNLTATAELEPDFTVGPRENPRIRFNLTAALDAPTNAIVEFRLESAEGAAARFTGTVTLLEANPALTVIDPAVGYLEASLNKGTLFTRSFSIVNRGTRDLLGVTLRQPTNVTWMAANLPVGDDGQIHLPDIAVGATNNISVVFAPPADTPTAYYQDRLIITGTNSPAQFPVNLYALITSSNKGSVLFKVDNILVQPVPDATIRIKNTVLQEEYTAKTDANGEALIEGLQEGPWAWQILAPGHASQSGNVEVIANSTVIVEPRLSRSLVTVNFTVTPVPFTDRYEITIEQTFQTHVPAPVLVMTPPQYEFFNVEAGFEATVIHNIKNHGLIKAFDMQIYGGADGYATTTPLINYVPELRAQESIDVPFRFFFRGRGTNAVSGGGAEAPLTSKSLIRDVDENGNITGGVEFPPGYGQPTPGDCTGGVFDVDNFAGALMAIANACAQCQDLKTLMFLATKGVQKYTEKAKFWNAIEGVIMIYRLLGCPSLPGGGGSITGGGGTGGSGGGGPGRGYTDYGTGGGCFVAGTEILLADGTLRRIEEIRTNDLVRTGPDARERATVAEVETRDAEALIEIKLADGRQLTTTPEHEIWVDGKGWTFANKLAAGDWLFTHEGSRLRIAAVDRVEKKVKVFTFTNREDHAFYANGVLVRDSCGDKTPFFNVPPELVPVSASPPEGDASGKEVAR